MELALKGKNILITGAAKGIGKALALAVADEGANIALHYHQSEAEAVKTAEEIRRLGVKVTLVQADISNFDEVNQMKSSLDAQLGPIDSIVNNAGYAQMKPFFQYAPEEWKREVDVCFHSVLNLSHLFVPEMMENQSGKFINIVGDSARTGDRQLIISAAARSGAISFLKSLAVEVGRSNIQCNTIALGLIDQGDLHFNPETMGRVLKQYPSGRLGNEQDVAGAVLFLLSNASNWITGQVLAVNGGHSRIG